MEEQNTIITNGIQKYWVYIRTKLRSDTNQAVKNEVISNKEDKANTFFEYCSGINHLERGGSWSYSINSRCQSSRKYLLWCWEHSIRTKEFNVTKSALNTHLRLLNEIRIQHYQYKLQVHLHMNIYWHRESSKR